MAFVDSYNSPCVVGGDFNVVQSLYEISGGHAQPQGAIDAFILPMVDCDLEDTGFFGSLYTNWHT